MVELLANCLAELRTRKLLPEPEHIHAVYVAGSIVRGWGNPSSDLDVYVITTEPWASDTARTVDMPVAARSIPLEVEFVDGRRWEVMYLLDEQVDEFLARVDPEPYEGGAGDLAVPEYSFLERLTYAEPLIGAQWLARRRGQVEASALRSMVTADRLDSLDNQTEDATGMLKAGDLESAVLAARNAFGHAVDALLAAHGEVGHGPKWRARRLRLTQPEALSFETYWALETMRSFDPDRPGDWVVEVLEACQDIALEIDL